MTDPTSHDTPAGKTMAEHRALHALLGEVEKASANAASAATDQALTKRLDSLHERLAAHFAGEEESGLFEQIEELAPERAHECTRLCEEHVGLLAPSGRAAHVAPAARDSDWATGIGAFLAP